MALSEEKIKKNTKKYLETGLAKGFINDELINLLGQTFISAPASLSSDQNNSFEGGLIDHLLLTTKYAVSINDSLPEDERVDKDSLIKVCLLYQIGKTFMFEKQTSEWHLNKGINYSFYKQNPPLKVSQLSLYYLSLCGIKLTIEEYTAIANFDVEDQQVKYHNSRLGDLLRAGNTFAIHKEKQNK
jgi:hypothetical protein